MHMIVAGHPNKAIARRLDIGQRTVDRIRSRVFRKLGVRGAVHLARVAAVVEDGAEVAVIGTADLCGPSPMEPGRPEADPRRQAVEICQRVSQTFSAAMMHFETAERLRSELPDAAAEAFDGGRRLLAEASRLIDQLQRSIFFVGEGDSATALPCSDAAVAVELQSRCGDLKRQAG
jgi:hypothetical protein